MLKFVSVQTWLAVTQKPCWKILGNKLGFYRERPRGAGFRSVNHAERWHEIPSQSQHLECEIHQSESSPSGSFIIIPQLVARWANYAIITQIDIPLMTFYRLGMQKAMFTNGTCLWHRGDFTIRHGNCNVTTACPRHLRHCESAEGLRPISDAH